jgi:hypothetical protein
MTVTAPKLRPGRPSRGQLHRLEREVSRFIHRRRAFSLCLKNAERWADDFLTLLHARWILVRAATTGPRRRLALTARSLRRSLTVQPRRQASKTPPKLAQALPADASARTQTPAATASLPSRRDRLESVVLWLCCIFVAVGSVLLIAAGREVRQMVDELAASHAQIRALQDRVARVEKDAQTLRSAMNSAAAEPVLAKSTLSLTRDEQKLVSQFIKVLPSQSAAPVTIQPGQALGAISTAPLPDAIIEQIPRLSGARFSIDPSGAIIISAAGSNRVDAVVTYPQ